MSSNPPSTPVLLYDGECPFCVASVSSWEQAAQGAVIPLPKQSGAGEGFGFPADQPMGAVKLIERDGTVLSGAEAVLRFGELCNSTMGTFFLGVYRRNRFFRMVLDAGYRMIAACRKRLPAPLARFR